MTDLETRFVPEEVLEPTERERQFREIEGMRFDTEIDESDEAFIVDEMKRMHENVVSGKSEHSSDPHSCFEHRLYNSTTDCTIEPLRPNSLLSGHDNVDSFTAHRERILRGNGMYGQLVLTEMDADHVADWTGKVVFDTDPWAVDALKELVRKEYDGELPQKRLLYEYTPTVFDQETGTVVMPHIKKIILGKGKEIELPPQLSSKFTVREIRDSLEKIFCYADDKNRVAQLDEKIRPIIDRSGWRFEME